MKVLLPLLLFALLAGAVYGAEECCTPQCDGECVVDCDGYWAPFSGCNATKLSDGSYCGGGVETSEFVVTQAQLNNGTACPHEVRYRECGFNTCPSDLSCELPERDVLFVVPTPLHATIFDDLTFGRALNKLAWRSMLNIYRDDINQNRDNHTFTDRFGNEDLNNDNRTTRISTKVYYAIDNSGGFEYSEFRNYEDNIFELRTQTGMLNIATQFDPGFGTARPNNFYLGSIIDSAVNDLMYADHTRPDAEKVIVLFHYPEYTETIYNSQTACDRAEKLGIKVVVVNIGRGPGVGGAADYTVDDTDSRVRTGKALASEPLGLNWITGVATTTNVGFIQEAVLEDLSGVPGVYITRTPDAADQNGQVSVEQQIGQAVRGSTLGDSCSLFGNGHLTTFDGNSLPLNGYGEYWLIAPCESESGPILETDLATPETTLTAQVRLAPCAYAEHEVSRNGVVSAPSPTGRTCARAFVFKYNTHTIEVNFDYEIGKATIIYNGNVLGRAPVGYAGADDGNCFNPVEGLDLQVTTEQRFLGGVDVTIKLASNVIKVRYEADAIGGSVILPGSPLLFSNRGVSSGLCGTYDKCPANDFQNRDDFIVSTSDKDTSIFYNFVEQWRVDPSASFFTATNSGSNYNFEEWVPTFVSIDRSNSREAEAACAYLPEGDFADWCGTEVDDIGSSISESYRFVYNEECDHFCTTGVFKTSAFNAMYANDESICQYRCEYAHPVDYSERDDSVLHLDEDEFDDVSVTVHSSDLPNAYFLFQSASQFGGTYTFQRNISRPDLCVEPNEDGEYEQGEDITTRTYTVEVSCMDLPDVSIVNPGTIRYGPYGFPVVQLRAIVDGDLPTKPQNPRFSWAVTGHEPRDGEVAVNVEDIAFSGGASPIAEFTPPAAGVFNISLALTDGCAIRRSKLQLTVVQKCCTPDIHMVPLSAVLYDDKDDGFGTNHVATLDGSAFDTNVYTPASDGQCPADERYPLGQNRDGGYLSLNYNWTLSAVSTTYGGSVVANVTEVSEDNFYVYRVIQEGEVLSNTTETIVDEYASGNSSVPDTEAPYNPATDLINHVATREGTFHFIYSVNNYTRVVQNVLNAVEEEAAECNVSISESGRGITYDVYPAAAASTSAYHTDYAECEGFYTFKSEFNVAEFGETCANDATGVSQVSCGRAPVTVFNCPTKTVFDYDARSFDDIDIVSYSFDEEGRPLFYKFNQTAGEDIDFSGCQDLGTGEGSGNACQVNVPGAGSYSVDVWVSNGCKQDYQTVTFTATCDDAINTVLTADASFDEADGSNTITVYVNETTAVVDNSAAAVSFIVSVEYLDDIAYEVQDQIPTPVSVSDVTKESYDVTFNVGGEALVFVQGSDSCTYSNASQTVTYNCQGSFNPVVADSTITVTYDEGDVAFSNADVNVTSIGNTSDFTATVRGWRLWNEDGDVSAFNAADDATFVVPTAGSYVAQYFIFDGCAYASRNVSITAVCNINVDASIVANASASSMELGDSIYLSSVDANDNAATYSWTWVQNPDEGLVGTSIGTSENVTVSADDVISGTYEVQVEICSACGNCDTDSFSFTTECPNDGSSITTNEDFTVTFTNQHFKLAELYANTNNLNGEVEEYTYVWRVTSAPEGSVYRPWQNITETETVMVNAEESELASSVVTTTNYTIIRTVNNVTYYATIDNTDKNEVDAFPACFHPDVAGAYEIELTIEDSCHVVASDSITVTAACNTAPVISASFESTVDLSSEFATATLIDATGTTDDENDQLIYTWEWVSWPQYNASIPVDEQDTPVTQGDETAVLTFTADFPGDYVVTLTVNDGCSEDSQTFTITADYTQCVSPPNATAGNFATAYDYLGRTTIPICLHGGANPEWSSAVVETYNETGRPSEVSDYPQYTSSSSDHLQQTMLVCDTKYTWELVSFDPTSRYTSSNPCSISANKDLKICGGKGISIPAPASTPDPEATSASPASTAQVSFVVLALVALLQVFQAIF